MTEEEAVTGTVIRHLFRVNVTYIDQATNNGYQQVAYLVATIADGADGMVRASALALARAAVAHGQSEDSARAVTFLAQQISYVEPLGSEIAT